MPAHEEINEQICMPAQPNGERPVVPTAEIRPLTLKLLRIKWWPDHLPDEPLMSSISTIAQSGVNAAGRRLEVSASNVGNVTSTGALPNVNGHGAGRGATGLCPV